MRRKMLGALLLPVPFAALPIAAVFFSSAPAATEGLVVQTPMPLEQRAAGVASAVAPVDATGDATLAYGIGGPTVSECGDYQPAVEG
ncbi:MAG: hypothetical protein M9925_04750 [Chloroflexi bacterium]|nr:hypothetical protein [Dehalococcoidia bacterium]MCO5200992.1 hypothetical protein [Chloroflexota bacterium]